jgi:hypothetical protein
MSTCQQANHAACSRSTRKVSGFTPTEVLALATPESPIDLCCLINERPILVVLI